MSGPGDLHLRQSLRALSARKPRRTPVPDGLPTDLCLRLEQTLLLCGPMRTASQCAAAFVDTRIHPWADLVPDADSPLERARALVAALYAHTNADSENVLVLFLEVIRDLAPATDACNRRLQNLIWDLQANLRGPQ